MLQRYRPVVRFECNDNTISPVRDIEMTTLGQRGARDHRGHAARALGFGGHLDRHRLARAKPREQNGISHFIEHMLFKGTTNRSAEDIARSVDSIGGNLDAFTAKELVCYNTKVLDEHLPHAFDVLADLVLQSAVSRRRYREGKGRHPRRDQDGSG